MNAPENNLAPRLKQFVDFYLSGMPAGRAYEAAGFKARGAGADTEASKSLRKPKVLEYLKTERKILSDLSRLEKWELLDFYQKVIRTPVGELDETSPLVQEVSTDTLGEAIIRKKIKMVSKMDAAREMARLMGWNAPEEHRHAIDSELAELIRRTRSGK